MSVCDCCGQPVPPATDPDAVWRIDISGCLDAKGHALSLNDYGLNKFAFSEKLQRIKRIVRNAVITADVPPLPAVHVQLHFRPASNRFRDKDNLVATLKPAIDALHQPDPTPNVPVPFTPIVPGDDPRYVSWEPPILHPWRRGEPAALWLVLRALERT